MVTDPHKKLTPREAAERIGFSSKHLANLRTYGGGPTYLKLGRKVVYALGDVDAWLETKRCTQSPRRATDDGKRKMLGVGNQYVAA